MSFPPTFEDIDRYQTPQGFMRSRHQILPDFLQVSGRFELVTCGCILAPRTLFIHFYLASIVSTFHAGIIHQSMVDYFPNGGLDIIDIPFEFGTVEATAEYALRAERLMQELEMEYDRVVLILTDHSDKDTGDLHIMHLHCPIQHGQTKLTIGRATWPAEIGPSHGASPCHTSGLMVRWFTMPYWWLMERLSPSNIGGLIHWYTRSGYGLQVAATFRLRIAGSCRSILAKGW